MAGAAIGVAAGSHPNGDQRAEALVLVGGPQSTLTRTPAARAAWTRTAAAIARSAQTAALARTATLPVRPVQRAPGTRPVPVHAVADPAAGVVRVSVTSSKPGLAQGLATAAALQTAALTRSAALASNGGSGIPLGDFEKTVDGWRAVGRFSTPPSGGGLSRTHARFGQGSLVVRCPARPAGCGPSVPVYYLFRAGATYTGVLWARATTPGARAVVVLGSAANDVSQSKLHSLGPAWRRFIVNWTPKRTTGEAELAFQSRSRRAARIGIDGAELLDPLLSTPIRRALSEAGQRRTMAGMSYVGVSPARPVGVATDTTPTILRALVGALAGLLVSLAAIGAVWVTRRRGQREA